MKRFHLVREEDVSGVSGTGIVAEGMQFSSGKAVLAWVTRYRSVAVYDSIADLEAIHGHDGRTKIQWFDDAAQREVQALHQEIERLNAKLLVESTVQEAGQEFAAFYLVPAGAWHRVLACARGVSADERQQLEARKEERCQTS